VNLANMTLNLKVLRDMARAETRAGRAVAPLSKECIDGALAALREQERTRRARIEESLRGLMLAADDTLTLHHSIEINIAAETGRKA